MAYPNPARSFVNLVLPTNTRVNYQVFNLQGKLMQKGEVDGMLSRNPQIDISNLPSGLYMVKVDGANLEQTFKIVKQ
nr:T9SS type A sorting domain-containing protein [Robertkochia marina]